MRSKLANFLLHAVGLALVCAIAAYWVIRIATPAPSAPPPPLAAAPARNVDPVLAARMFGLVQTAAVAASNVQVAGVYSAGLRSAAILVVDGKPPRVYVQGAQITPGSTLAEIHPDRVIIEVNGARQEVRAPARPAVAAAGAARPPGYTREGDVLSAPTVSAAPGAARAAASGLNLVPPPAIPSPPPPPPPAPPEQPPIPPAAVPQAQVPPVQPGIVTQAPPEAQSEEGQEPQRLVRRRRSPLAGGAPSTD
jgi:general secretion pathway protein C